MASFHLCNYFDVTKDRKQTSAAKGDAKGSIWYLFRCLGGCLGDWKVVEKTAC